MDAVRDRIDRAFALEIFRDHLVLEAGSSRNTVEAYLRDIRRLGEFARLRRQYLGFVAAMNQFLLHGAYDFLDTAAFGDVVRTNQTDFHWDNYTIPLQIAE